MRGQVQYMPCRISHLQSCHLIMKCSFEDKRQQMLHRLGDCTSYMRIHSHALLLPVLHWPWVSVAHPQRPIVFLSISVRVWSFSVCSKNTRLKKKSKNPKISKNKQKNPPNQQDLPPLAAYFAGLTGSHCVPLQATCAANQRVVVFSSAFLIVVAAKAEVWDVLENCIHALHGELNQNQG